MNMSVQTDHPRTPLREKDRHNGPELATIGILETLAQDPRPTLVLDLTLTKQSSLPPVVHRNPALRSHFALNELISGRVIGHSDLDYISFRDWIVNQSECKKKGTRASVRSFGGMSWTAFTVRSRYQVVSGVLEEEKNPDKDTTDLTPATQHLYLDTIPIRDDDNDDGDGASLASTERHATGCTDLSVAEKRFTPFVQFFRSVDWSATVLGNMDDWPLQLHQMANFVMNDPTPAFVLWGKKLSVIYNEAAIEVLLDRHPRVMGLPLQEVYPEVWDQISILIHKVEKTGKAVRVENVPMLLNRRGRMDECFFSFQYQPIQDERGVCLGVYESFSDVTKQNHAARRLSLLLAISTCSSVARDMSDFWRLLLEALDTSEALPFAMLYTTSYLSHAESAPATPNPARGFQLQGQLGIPDDHITCINELHLSLDAEGYGSAMNKANESGEPVFLSVEEGSLPAEFVEGIDLRSVQTPANTVVVWPICPAGLGEPVAFIIMGLNPHLGLDDEMKGFLEIMQRQIATSAAAILLFEDEVRHRQDVATQLELRTRELLKSELKFQRISDNSLVGITTIDLDGNIAYANQAFRDITGHSGEDSSMSSWLDLFMPDVAASLKEVWLKLHATREPLVAEFPLKKPWTKILESGETLKGPTWILLSAFLEEDEDGNTNGSLATMTDISQQKWAEEHQKRRMEEAIELKRQQEAFVDMTSHEASVALLPAHPANTNCFHADSQPALRYCSKCRFHQLISSHFISQQLTR
jgi:PAS domain S-box-containing protein